MNKRTTFNQIFESKNISLLSIYPDKTIGDKIKLLRLKSGLSYNEFAKKANVGTMTIYRWESNQRIPNKQYLNQLINNFNLSKNYFDIRIRKA
ncbi:helix-turn-helix domain-containing protein [Clostridium sardiniense]|uniref:helix-turn-helix domain-containing protein n=1 Tax=Clostridium sardiniense TaxID=29369 RepID=UPI003D3585D0